MLQSLISKTVLLKSRQAVTDMPTYPIAVFHSIIMLQMKAMNCTTTGIMIKPGVATTALTLDIIHLNTVLLIMWHTRYYMI